MSKGYIYILSNESFRGLLKIGKTTRSVQQRANELWSTGVPSPFKVEYDVLTPDCDALECMAHSSFAPHRLSSDREFFKLTISDAIQTLDDLLREQVEELVSEFIPDQVIVDSMDFVDLGSFRKSVYEAISPSNIQPPDFAELLYHIEGGEIAPAIKRMEETITKRREVFQAKQAELKVV